MTCCIQGCIAVFAEATTGRPHTQVTLSAATFLVLLVCFEVRSYFIVQRHKGTHCCLLLVAASTLFFVPSSHSRAVPGRFAWSWRSFLPNRLYDDPEIHPGRRSPLDISVFVCCISEIRSINVRMCHLAFLEQDRPYCRIWPKTMWQAFSASRNKRRLVVCAVSDFSRPQHHHMWYISPLCRLVRTVTNCDSSACQAVTDLDRNIF